MIFNVGQAVEVGKPMYRIESYRYGWMIQRYVGQKKVKAKDGSHVMADNWDTLGYYSSLDSTVKALGEKHLRLSDGEGAVEALRTLQRLGDDLRVTFAAALPQSPPEPLLGGTEVEE